MLTVDKVKKLIPSVYTNQEMRSNQELWNQWYKGFVPSFHNYSRNNGITVRQRKMPVLRMASKVCESWCSALLSEDWQIEISSSKGKIITAKTSSFVIGSSGTKGVIGSTNFKFLLNDCIERSMGLGCGAITVNLEDIGVDEFGTPIKTKETRIGFNTFNAFEIFPISYQNRTVLECAFCSQKVYNNTTYDVLTTYTLNENKEYIITNRVFNNDKEVSPEEIGLIGFMNTHSKLPWFFIIRTSKTNTIDYNSPFGESVFSDSIDVLEQIDLTYTCIQQELLACRPLILFNSSLLTTDEQGRRVVPSDAMEQWFQFYSDEMTNSTDNFVKEFHPKFNSDLNDELQMQLSILSSKCGLGRNTFQIKDNASITATEVRYDEKTASRSLKRQAILLQQTLQQIIYTIVSIGADILGLNVDTDCKVRVVLRPTTEEEMSIEYEKDLTLVDKGILTVDEFRQKHLAQLGIKLENKSSESNNS